MLNLIKLVVSSALICSAAACSLSVETAEMIAKTDTSHATVKPRANVSMTSALPKIMSSGAFYPVQLSFEEAYTQGVMTVSVKPSADLDLFGGEDLKTFDLAEQGPHVWNLDVKSQLDGIYTLDVFTEAHNESRSFSVQLNMGQIAQKTSKTVEPENGELVDGGKIRVMDAEETIQ